jgi:hypothetical protein
VISHFERVIYTYIPEESNKKSGPDGGIPDAPPALRGLTLRRILGIEPKQRVQCRVYIEQDFLAELHRKKSRPDLNTEVNLALEVYLTSEPEIHPALVDLKKESTPRSTIPTHRTSSSRGP